MLFQPREKLIHTRFSTTASIQHRSILSSNPQIQELVHKLLTISEIQQKPRNFRMTEWQRQRYHPSEIENRMKIENEISLKKIRNQKIRSRIKPVKKRTLSNNITSHQQTAKTYKEIYQEIKRAEKQQIAPKHQSSQEQHQEPYPIHDHVKEGIKYYDNLKRYGKIFNFIEDRIEHRSSKQQKKLSSYSQTIPTSFDSQQSKPKKILWTKQRGQQANKRSSTRIYTVMNKLRPRPKIEGITKGETRNKTSSNTISKEEMQFAGIVNSTIEIQSSLFNSKARVSSNTRRYHQN